MAVSNVAASTVLRCFALGNCGVLESLPAPPALSLASCATTGFKTIDMRKFHGLPEAVLVEWHRKGFLALVYAHLASHLCWNDLARKTGLNDVAEKAGEA